MLNQSNSKKNKYTLLYKIIITLASLSATVATELTIPQQSSPQSIIFPTFLYPSFMPKTHVSTTNSLIKGPHYEDLTSLFTKQNEEDDLFIEDEKEMEDLLTNTQTQFLRDMTLEKLFPFFKKISTGYDEQGIHCTYSIKENYIFHSKNIRMNRLNLDCLTNLQQIEPSSKIKLLTPLNKKIYHGYQIAYYGVYPDPEVNQPHSFFWIEAFNPKLNVDLTDSISLLLYQNQQEKIVENLLQEMTPTSVISPPPPLQLTFSLPYEDEIIYFNKKAEIETEESPLILTIYLPPTKPQNPITVDLSQNQSEYPTTIVVLSKKIN